MSRLLAPNEGSTGRWAGTVILAAVVGVVSMVLTGFAIAGRGDSSAEAASAFGVYLRPSDASIADPIDVSLVQQRIEGRTFTAVEDANSLTAFVDSAHPQSIWIHRSALPSVSAEWLRSRMADGIVIVGIDMPAAEIASILRVDGGSTPDWNPPNTSTFVVIGQALAVPYTNEAGEPATRSRFTRGNSTFDPEDPRGLIAAVNRVIGNIRETYGGSP